MITKQKPTVFLIGFVLLAGFFYFLTSFRISRVTEIILGSFFMYSSSVAIGLFFNLFVREEVFYSWAKNSMIWTVVIFISVVISIQPGDGFIPNPLAPLAPIAMGLFVLSTPLYLYFKSNKFK